jgi:hypothetical protein
VDARQIAHVLRETRPGSGERVLVAVMNDPRDLEIARTEGWYRIPVKRAPKQVGADYLALYLTGRFPPHQRHRVTYYAPIRAYRLVRRVTLFPDAPDHPRAQESYFKIEIGPLQALDVPVVAEKLRRITFISTSLDQLRRAREIRELWHKPSYHETLWRALSDQDEETRRA